MNRGNLISNSHTAYLPVRADDPAHCYQIATADFHPSQADESSAFVGSVGPVHHGRHGNSTVYHIDLTTQNYIDGQWRRLGRQTSKFTPASVIPLILRESLAAIGPQRLKRLLAEATIAATKLLPKIVVAPAAKLSRRP